MARKPTATQIEARAISLIAPLILSNAVCCADRLDGYVSIFERHTQPKDDETPTEARLNVAATLLAAQWCREGASMTREVDGLSEFTQGLH